MYFVRIDPKYRHNNYWEHYINYYFLSTPSRPTSRTSSGTNQNNNGGVALPVGLADDQAKDFDFEKTEMKYDSTGMFHWGPARNLEECILVSCNSFENLVNKTL